MSNVFKPGFITGSVIACGWLLWWRPCFCEQSVREQALTLGAVDSAAVPLRQLEAGNVSTSGTIGVQVATKIMAHLGCSGERGAEAAAVAAIGPIIRIASGWTEVLRRGFGRFALLSSSRVTCPVFFKYLMIGYLQLGYPPAFI